MSEDYFKFLNEEPKFITDISLDLLCLLCGKVMIKPTCTPCGCEFCYKCIYDYLKCSHNTCPGLNEECCNIVLDFESLVFSNNTNDSILNLHVKCPGDNCDFVECVSKMVIHIKSCNYVVLECPFLNFGCDAVNMKKEELEIHLKRNQENHLGLILNFNNDMKKRFEEVEKKVELSNSKILKDIVFNLESQNHILTAENLDIKGYIGNLQAENEEIKKENEEIKEKLKCLQIDFDQIKDKLNGKLELHDVTNESSTSAVDANSTDLSVNICPFNWKVTDVDTKISMDNDKCQLWTPTFASTSNGYHMRSGIRFLNNRSSIQAFGQIVNGPNDATLHWPCRKYIQIHFIRQYTTKSCYWLTVKFDNPQTSARPISNENPIKFSNGCVKVDELKAALKVTRLDKLDICVYVY